MHRIIVFLIIALASHACFGWLIVGSSSPPGSYCYSECQYTGCLVVGRCDCGASIPYILGGPYCDDNDPYTNCRLGTSGNSHVFCYEGGEQACAYCGASGGLYAEAWESIGSGRARQRVTITDSSDYYECAAVSERYDYGCDYYYYRTGGSGSGISCATCPTMTDTGSVVRNGMSTIGNATSITACSMSSAYTFANTSGTFNFASMCSASP